MKKIFFLLFLSFVLAGCSMTKKAEITTTKNTTNQNVSSNTCHKYFTIGTGINQNLSLKAKVVSSDIKNIISNNAGIVSYLNCENGKFVTKKTLIAKIKPDWSDTNVKNLLNQKQALQNQILNIKNIIASTNSDFSLQESSLQNQKQSLENQIKILQNSLNKLLNQKKYGVNDIKSQLSSLQTQLKDLQKSKANLENSKKADLDKLNQNIKNNILQADSLSKNILLKIDEIFGITDKNKHKNDAFENYLSAKNTSLKEKIKTDFIKLNNNFPTSYTGWSFYLGELDELVNLIKEAIKDSVASRTFPQSQIDAFYNIFVQYDQNLINLKNGLDTLIHSLETVKNNYDNQITNLSTQIDNITNQIENINANKLNSYINNLDIQINQTKSQIDNLQTNLVNIISQINSLKEKRKIQIKQLENQLSQLQSSLNQININLQEQKIYANVKGKVKEKKVSVGNKIGQNSLICQIVPEKAGLKLQVYTNQKIKIGANISFKNDDKICKSKIISLLPYKEPVSLNNIYETDNFAICDGKKIDFSNLFSEGKVIDVNYNIENKEKEEQTIKIPLDFVINKISGKYVKKVLSGGKIEIVKIKLKDIDGLYAEVLSGIKLGDKICK